MAPVINLYDGVSTIQLNNSSPIMTRADWVPAVPRLEENTIQNVGDGDYVNPPTWRNVTETIPLLLIGSASTITSSLSSIQRMLDFSPAGRGHRTKWLRVQYDHDSQVWRSEILAARVVPGNANRLTMGTMEVSLIITRRYYWEGPETQLELSGPIHGATTNYVSVYNDDDATANSNWFQVAAAEVDGDLPTPIKLELRNQSGSTKIMRGIYLGNYAHIGTTVDPIILGSASSVSGATHTWASDSEELTHRFGVPASLIQNFDGRSGHVMAVFSSTIDVNTLVRASLQYGFSGNYYDVVIGEWVVSGGHCVLDLGTFPIPPSGYTAIEGNFYLTLHMQGPSGDSVTVDWMQVLPAGPGQFRELRELISYINIANNDLVTDDALTGIVYATESGVNTVQHRGYGDPLHVWPNLTQRFRMIVEGSLLEAGAAYGVKAWYRPRRLIY